MEFILDIGIFFLNLIYDIHKLFPTQNKICMLSRQSETISADAQMLMRAIHNQDPDVKTVSMYRMLPPDLIGRIRYLFYMIGPEMHTLATSRVVILEGYCISVSVLKHKKGLKVVQMWHAMGALKKFGYLSVDEPEGTSSRMARAMHMHENYDYILVSSAYCEPYYEAAFRYDQSHMKILPLPRTDLLRSDLYMERKEEEICRIYSELAENSGKKNILYIPTFRKNREKETKAAVQDLIRAVDFGRYNLILKLHPLEEEDMYPDGVLRCPEFESLELFSVADYVISDYSAMIFEAAVAGKPLFLYDYDLDYYTAVRGFCIDYIKEMPTTPYRDAKDVFRAIEKENWDPGKLKALADKFVERKSNCTWELAAFVLLLYNEYA